MSRRTSQPGQGPSKLASNSREKSPSQKIHPSSQNFSSFRNSKSPQQYFDSPSDDQFRVDHNLSEFTGHFPGELKGMGPQQFYIDISHLAGESNFGPQPQRTPLQQRDNSPLKPEQMRGGSYKPSPITKGKGIFQQPHRDELERADYINVSAQLLSGASAMHNDNSLSNIKSKAASPHSTKPQSQNRKMSQKENSQLTPHEAKRKQNKSKSPEHSTSFDRSMSQGKKPIKDARAFHSQKSDSHGEYLSATFRALNGENVGLMTDSSRDGRKQQQSFHSGQGEDRHSSNIVEQIKNNLQHVTRCRVHNQSYTLFNTMNKQFACIECVYSIPLQNKKQHTYISLKNAAATISEQNRIYKAEAVEKAKTLDENLHVCQASIQLLQQNFEHLLSLINKEFQALYEEMLARRELLVETARSITQSQINELEGKMQNLEFLNGCFKDARDIDPFQNFELGVHFYGVFNLLRNTMKSFDCHIQKPTTESLNIVEFPNRAETHMLLANYGKVNFQKPPKVGLALKKANFSSSPSKFILTPVKAKKQEQNSQIVPSASGSKLSKSPSQQRNNRAQRINEISTSSHKKTEKKGPYLSFDRKIEYEPETRKSFQEFVNRTEIQGAYGPDTPSKDKISTQFLSPTLQSSPDRGLLHPEYEEHKFDSRTPPRNLDGGDSVGEYLLPNSLSDQGRTSAKDVHSVGAETDFMKEHEQLFQSKSTNRFLFQESALGLRYLDLTEVLPPKFSHVQLLYQLSRDGASSAIFHSKVDGRAPLIVFIKANSDYLFGYYTPNAFSREDKYTTSEKTYLFSLKNPELKAPMIFPIKTDKKFIAIYQNSKSPCLGSTLHQKQDLWIQ